jgi:hypothetical protein
MDDHVRERLEEQHLRIREAYWLRGLALKRTIRQLARALAVRIG